jgi:hypothetical protein
MGSRRKLDIIVDAEYKGGSEISQAKNDISDLDGAAGKSSMNFGAMAGQLAVVTGGVVAVGAAAAVAYEAINEGAALEAAAGKFDNLSASINTTGDALLGKMREATKGMITDAELVAAGTDIMNLGLSKTEGGVVRMSAAVGALNLDMGVLAMTLANDSVEQLDALGLAMEDVNNTKKELINSGFIGDAFDEAVLIELEKKMVLLGDASLTTAGQLQVVQTEWKNVTDEMKKNAAEGAAPLVMWMSKGINQSKMLDEALQKGVVTQQEYNIASANLGAGLTLNDTLFADITSRVEDYDAAVQQNIETAATYTAYQQAVADSLNATAEVALSAGAGYETYTNAILGAQLQQENFNASQLAGQEAIAMSVEGYTALSGFLGTLDGTAIATATSMQGLAASIIEQSLAAQVAAGEMTPLQAAISSINTQEGIGLVTPGQAEELRGAALEFQNLNTIVGESATAWAESGSVTTEQGQLIAEKIALIGTTAISTEDQMRLMAVNSGDSLTTLGGDYTSLTDEIIALSTTGGESLLTLGGSFEVVNGIVDSSFSKMANLNDAIMSLPEKKTIIIEIKTVGSVPTIPGGGGGAAGSAGAGVPTAVSDSLGG